MSISWTFDADAGPWSTAQFSWDGGDGNPAPGCLTIAGLSGSALTSVMALSVPVADFDTLAFWVKFNRVGGSLSLNLTAKDGGGGTLGLLNVSYGIGDPDASTWTFFSADVLSAGTVASVEFSVATGGGGTLTNLWVDTIGVLTAELETRHLGLAADQARLYLTMNENDVLTLKSYSLADMTLAGSATFGAATMGEIDDRERWLAPVTRPGADGVLFLRGRDGNDVQVQSSDDSGATFGDVGDAGWASTKVCVALLPDPLRPEDLVVVFDDDDLYRSIDAGESWTKLADAPATLRTAARNLSAPGELLLAAQAADTIYFSNNLGATTEDVSDAALNTINAIEVSR